MKGPTLLVVNTHPKEVVTADCFEGVQSRRVGIRDEEWERPVATRDELRY